MKNIQYYRASILVVMLLFSSMLFAQNSQKAADLLDKVSERIENYQNMRIDFNYTLENTEENIFQQNTGNITIAKNNYNLDFMGNTFMSNGKHTYIVVPEDEEVSIFNEDPSSNESINPSKFLYFYKEGYSYILDALDNVNGRKIQYIKLLPLDSEAEITHVLLGIDVYTHHIYKLIEVGKNGTQTTLQVNEFKVDQPISEQLFVFDKEAYMAKNFTIIDETLMSNN